MNDFGRDAGHSRTDPGHGVASLGVVVRVRAATTDDAPLLLDLLLEALNWTGEQRVSARGLDDDVHAVRYLDGWMLPTDLGLVAVDDPSGGALDGLRRPAVRRPVRGCGDARAGLASPMPSSRFLATWDALPPAMRSRLVHAPLRALSPEEVDVLARAGARDTHAIWFESRPGRTRQWALTWEFRRFVEDVRDSDGLRRAPEKRWSVLLRAGVRPG
jgi:hypothetical protein